MGSPDLNRVASGLLGAGGALVLLALVATSGEGVPARLAGFAVISAGALLLVRESLAEIWRTAREAIADDLREARLHVAALATVLVVALVVRLVWLFEPVRFDEAFSFLFFATLPVEDALTSFSEPNNHLLNTLMTHGAWKLFGDDPWVLRLPSLLAGTLLLPAVYAAGRLLYDRDTGLLAAALVAGSATLVDFSVNGRGYSLVCLWSALLLALGAWIVRSRSPAATILYGLTAVLGLYSLLVMAFPLAVVSIWVGLNLLIAGGDDRLQRLTWFIGALAAAALATLLLYEPTFGQEGWEQDYPSTDGLLRATWDTWTSGLPGFFMVVLVIGVAASLVLHLWIARQRVPLLLAGIVVPLLLAVLPDTPPFPRSYLPLFVYLLILAAAGVVGVARVARLEVRARTLAAGAAAVAVALVFSLALERSELPFEGGPAFEFVEPATRLIAEKGPKEQPVVVHRFAIPNYWFYFRREGLERARVKSHNETGAMAQVPRAMVVIDGMSQYSLDNELLRLQVPRDRLLPPRLVARRGPIRLYEVSARSGNLVLAPGQ